MKQVGNHRNFAKEIKSAKILLVTRTYAHKRDHTYCKIGLIKLSDLFKNATGSKVKSYLLENTSEVTRIFCHIAQLQVTHI